MGQPRAQAWVSCQLFVLSEKGAICAMQPARRRAGDISPSLNPPSEHNIVAAIVSSLFPENPSDSGSPRKREIPSSGFWPARQVTGVFVTRPVTQISTDEAKILMRTLPCEKGRRLRLFFRAEKEKETERRSLICTKVA